jgi:hypothetical protein
MLGMRVICAWCTWCNLTVFKFVLSLFSFIRKNESRLMRSACCRVCAGHVYHVTWGQIIGLLHKPFSLVIATLRPLNCWCKNDDITLMLELIIWSPSLLSTLSMSMYVTVNTTYRYGEMWILGIFTTDVVVLFYTYINAYSFTACFDTNMSSSGIHWTYSQKLDCKIWIRILTDVPCNALIFTIYRTI